MSNEKAISSQLSAFSKNKRRISFVPDGTGNDFDSIPSDESLGYYHWSLTGHVKNIIPCFKLNRWTIFISPWRDSKNPSPPKHINIVVQALNLDRGMSDQFSVGG